MNEISRILCVIDPTTNQQHAMQRAAWLAEHSKAKLELFVCYYNEYLAGERFFDSRSLAKARDEIIAGFVKHLEKLAAPLRKKGIDVTVKASWDHPLHDGIVRRVAAAGADIVFKDTHYHSAAARVLLSNTDWQLIRNVRVPLWLVKPRDIGKKPMFVAAIDPMNEHDKPAALDDEILVTGKALSKACGGELHAFHAFDPRIAVASATTNAYLPVSLPMNEFAEQMREHHGKRFGEVTAYHDIPEKRAHLVAGRTHEELPAFATEHKADVIVMGAVARNRWRRLFVGATAERTLDHLPCDLLIVKPDWFETPSDIINTKEQAA